MGVQFPPLKGELEEVLALGDGLGKTPQKTPSLMFNPFRRDFVREMNHNQNPTFQVYS